ncbi:hypothetical protein JJJ22_00325 [Aeromonas caviae]|uniref:hypothetical protein n=1 Tax=Aeromonas caviae TaxID=648 RepID=UPI0019052EAD|nr:hypothetical protein [Aeromonas caviae]QQM75696.1 hypothetical protein JH254_20435 [Aeromonas caviae]QQV19561.1 hypothetical protein JJJ22_00325 [Aeromonas caviae]
MEKKRMLSENHKMFAKELAKEEKLRQQEQKRAERQRKILHKICNPAPSVALITPFWETWSRKTGQHNRRSLERAERNQAIAKLGPINHLAHLVCAMEWHPHHAHILIVATDPVDWPLEDPDTSPLLI